MALAGVAVPFVEGIGMQGVTVRRDQGLTGMLGAGLRVALEVTARFRVLAQATASLYLPQVRVLFAETVVAISALPLLEGRAGIELSL